MKKLQQDKCIQLGEDYMVTWRWQDNVANLLPCQNNHTMCWKKCKQWARKEAGKNIGNMGCMLQPFHASAANGGWNAWNGMGKILSSWPWYSKLSCYSVQRDTCNIQPSDFKMLIKFDKKRHLNLLLTWCFRSKYDRILIPR